MKKYLSTLFNQLSNKRSMLYNPEDDKLLVHKEDYLSLKKAFQNSGETKIVKWLMRVMGVILLFMLFPWTQNIQAPGMITTRLPEQRPQQLNSIIGGRIEKWYVKEGDMVKKGDTILKITEVKDSYLDPQLLERTKEQIKAKEQTVDYYQSKSEAIQNQLSALNQVRQYKMQQLRNKIKQAVLYVQSDSMALEAVRTELKIATDQYKRQEELFKQGLKSLTELEQRKQQLQNATAKALISENKFINSKNDLLNARIELNQTDREFNEKIAKAQGERFSTLSDATTGQGEIAKLRNQFSNYNIRNGFYFVLAPQDGQITKTISAGIGEVVKEGAEIAKIVPQNFKYAVEMYVEPVDIALVSTGQKVRFQFDGWPAIVFSGWPNVSYGTYPGKVVAIDNAISDNGKFRILVAEDAEEQPWPRALRIGGGAKGMALLKDVTVIYEIWRRMNGFPPDFYKAMLKPEDKKSKKK